MRSTEITQSQKHTEERLREKWTGTCGTIPKYLAFMTQKSQKEMRNSLQEKKNWVIVENLPNLAKTINLQIKIIEQTPKGNKRMRKCTRRHTITKFMETKNKEKILKTEGNDALLRETTISMAITFSWKARRPERSEPFLKGWKKRTVNPEFSCKGKVPVEIMTK